MIHSTTPHIRLSVTSYCEEQILCVILCLIRILPIRLLVTELYAYKESEQYHTFLWQTSEEVQSFICLI